MNKKTIFSTLLLLGIVTQSSFAVSPIQQTVTDNLSVTVSEVQDCTLYLSRDGNPNTPPASTDLVKQNDDGTYLLDSTLQYYNCQGDTPYGRLTLSNLEYTSSNPDHGYQRDVNQISFYENITNVQSERLLGAKDQAVFSLSGTAKSIISVQINSNPPLPTNQYTFDGTKTVTLTSPLASPSAVIIKYVSTQYGPDPSTDYTIVANNTETPDLIYDKDPFTIGLNPIKYPDSVGFLIQGNLSETTSQKYKVGNMEDDVGPTTSQKNIVIFFTKKP